MQTFPSRYVKNRKEKQRKERETKEETKKWVINKRKSVVDNVWAARAHPGIPTSQGVEQRLLLSRGSSHVVNSMSL